MLNRYLLSFLLLVPLTAVANTHYINGHWYVDGEFQQQDWFEVDGRFTQSKPENIDSVIDLKGGYALPPFADAHNHNLQNPYLAENFSARYLETGTLYGMMLCGSHSDADTTREILKVTGLQIELAGACISSSDGHPLRMALQPAPGMDPPEKEAIWDNSYIVMDSLSDIDAKWPLIEQAGGNVIKLITVHSEDESRRDQERFYGINGLHADIVPELISKAHEENLRVAVHIDSAYDFEQAIKANADFVAHLPGYFWQEGYTAKDYLLSDEVAVQAGQSTSALITTTKVSANTYQDNAEVGEKVRAVQKQNLEKLKHEGANLIIGSDLFMESVHEEIIHLVSFEVFTVAEVLNMAVRTTPETLFPGRNLGRIAEGYEASFVLINGNPMENIKVIKDVSLLVSQGKVLQSVN